MYYTEHSFRLQRESRPHSGRARNTKYMCMYMCMCMCMCMDMCMYMYM